MGVYLIFQFWATVQRLGRRLCCSYRPMGQSNSEEYLQQCLEMGFVVNRSDIHEEYQKLLLRQGLLSCSNMKEFC